VTVANQTDCVATTFSATGLPLAIPDNNPAGITSVVPVVGNGNVATMTLSLAITHPFRGDLKVMLVSPAGTQFVVSNRAGGSADNLVINNQVITAFTGQTAAGNWKLVVSDQAAIDSGTLNSWSLHITGSCIPQLPWSGNAAPHMPTIDNSSACTSLNVTQAGDASLAKLDLSGRHDFRSALRGTLAHNGVTVSAFPTGTFPSGSGPYSFINRAVAGFTGSATGTWTLCIVDTDAFGDTGALDSWSVHN
jgi:subtilisin-like proprotein convertase family protein